MMYGFGCTALGVLGGSWDLVSMVIHTLIGVISNHKYSCPKTNRNY